MSACSHEHVEATGEIEDQGDTHYVDGVCIDCGADAALVYPVSHYLVFEEEGEDPVEVEVA